MGWRLEWILFPPLTRWPWLRWVDTSIYRRAWDIYLQILMGNLSKKVRVTVANMPVYYLTPPDSSVSTDGAFKRSFSHGGILLLRVVAQSLFWPKGPFACNTHKVLFPALNWKAEWAGLVARARGLGVVMRNRSFFQECFRSTGSTLATCFSVNLNRPSITFLLPSASWHHFTSLSLALRATTFGSAICNTIDGLFIAQHQILVYSILFLMCWHYKWLICRVNHFGGFIVRRDFLRGCGASTGGEEVWINSKSSISDNSGGRSVNTLSRCDRVCSKSAPNTILSSIYRRHLSHCKPCQGKNALRLSSNKQTWRCSPSPSSFCHISRQLIHPIGDEMLWTLSRYDVKELWNVLL